MHLRDRLGTAWTLIERRQVGSQRDETFASLVQQDAEAHAQRIDVRSVEPLVISSIWFGVIALAVAVALAQTLVPDLDSRTSRLITAEEPPPAEPTIQQREDVARAIEEAVADLPPAGELGAAAQEQLEALDRLAEQIESPSASAEELEAARVESAARLRELADDLAEQSMRDLEAADELVRRFRRAEQPDAPMSMNEFAEALARGDFGNAAELMERVLKEADELPLAQRKEVAEHLRQLSDAFDSLDGDDAKQLQERAAQLEQALEDQGIDQKRLEEQLGDGKTREALERAIREQGTDPDVARELARDLESLTRDREIDEQTNQDARDVADALERAAESLQQQEPEQQQQPQRQQEKQEQEQSQDEPPPARPTESDRAPATRQGDGEWPQSEPQPERASPTPSNESGESRSRSGEPAVPQGQSVAPASTEQHGEQVPKAADEQRGPVPTDVPAPSRPPTKDGSTHVPSADDRKEKSVPPEESPSAPPSDSPPGAAPAPQGKSPTDPAPRSVPGRSSGPEEALRELDRRRSDSEQQRQAAERIRDAANRLRDDSRLGPRELGAGPYAEPGADAGETSSTPTAPLDVPTVEDVNVTEEDIGDRPIARWFGDGEPAGLPRDAETRSTTVRQAQRVAERAVNDAVVPGRYHRLIRRYFRRLPENAETATPSTEVAEP